MRFTLLSGKASTTLPQIPGCACYLVNGSLPFHTLCCCSVIKSCPTLCNPMNCSMPGFLVLHHLPELSQIHVHWVGHAIQPSHPLLPPSPPISIFPNIRVFSNESVFLIRWPNYWRFSFSISPSKEYSELISFRMDWLDLLAAQGLSRAFSSTTAHRHRFFGVQPSLWPTAQCQS